MLELIRSYYRYEQWATARVLEAAEVVPFEQLTVPVLTGFDPVRAILVHTMGAQFLWMQRWRGEQPMAMFDPVEFGDLGVIRQRWNAIDIATDRFLEELTEERLGSDIRFAGLQRPAFVCPLWQAMLHQANHATYHRGEAAAILTHLGSSPGELDYLRMTDGRR